MSSQGRCRAAAPPPLRWIMKAVDSYRRGRVSRPDGKGRSSRRFFGRGNPAPTVDVEGSYEPGEPIGVTTNTICQARIVSGDPPPNRESPMVSRPLPAFQARIVSGDTPPLSVSFADSSPRGGAKGAAAPVRYGRPPLRFTYSLFTLHYSLRNGGAKGAAAPGGDAPAGDALRTASDK